MAKYGHNLPSVLEPDGEICVQVSIPNHPDYIKLFVRAVRMLETQRMYERDENLSAKIVAAQWRDRTVTPLIEALANGLGCADGFSDCLSYSAYAGFIKYFPDNPFVDGEPVPSGYLTAAWWRWGAFETALPDWIDDWVDTQIEQFTGYKNNDAVCWISSLLSLNIPAWLDSGYSYPAIEIELSGKGTIELVMVSMPLGSRALIEVDEKPNIIDIITGGTLDPNLDVIDTARDWSSFPPEEYPEVRYKVEIPEDGDHTVYVMFLPVINFTISDDAIGFGGGLRSVELCGGLRPRDMPEQPPPPPLEGVEELRPEFQFTPECGFEYRLRDQNDAIVQDWQPIAGWDENAFLCFGGNMATKEEIYEAIIQASEEISSRILLAQDDNVKLPIKIIDGIGNGKEIEIDDSEVDPDAPEFNSKEERAGGAIGVLNGIRAFYLEINGYANDELPILSVMARIEAKYLVNDGMQTALQGYFESYETLPTDWDIPVWPDTLAGRLYCKGATKQVIASYITDIWDAEVEDMLAINSAFEQAQIDQWFAQGETVPSTQYLAYPCVPVQSETLILNMAGTGQAVEGTVIHKENHRLLVTITGKVPRPDIPAETIDFFYRKNAAGTITWESGISIISGAGVVKPSQSEVPYDDAGEYRFTIDTTTTGELTFTRDNGAHPSNTVGTMTVHIQDLGEYAI